MKTRIFLLTVFAALCGVCAADNGDPNQNSATTQTPSTEQVAVPKDTIYKNGKMKVKRSRLHRFDREIQKTVFVPKGTWLGGASISYASKDYKNLNTLLVKDIDADGYSFGVTPIVGYFVANNVAVGARFAYNRSKIDLRNFDLNLGSNFNIKLKDYYYLEHDFQVIGFARTYMSLGGSKVFGFFSEMRAAYGRSQAKMTTGQYGVTPFDGTYSVSNYLYIGFSPGLTAFVQDWMAVEVQLGVLGFNFKWTDQVTNQVETGSEKSFSGKFQIDLFSRSIGSTIYF